MIEITAVRPDAPARRAEPATAEEAFFSLQRGNRALRTSVATEGTAATSSRWLPRNSDSDRFRHRAAPDAQCRAIGLRGRPSAVELVFSSRPTTSSRCAWQATCSTGICWQHRFRGHQPADAACDRRRWHTGCGAARRLWTRISTQPVVSSLSADLPLRHCEMH